MKRTILITGGAGFIGNHVVRRFVNKYPEYRIINLDKLTYAGNLANLKDIDIAFLPCNQPYTMTIDQLAKAARTISPKVLFPYHYSETPISQAVMKLGGSGIDVRIRDYK